VHQFSCFFVGGIRFPDRIQFSSKVQVSRVKLCFTAKFDRQNSQWL
jgi:hypothetical protein